MSEHRECTWGVPPTPGQGRGTMNHGLWVSPLPFLVRQARICPLPGPRRWASCPGRGRHGPREPPWEGKWPWTAPCSQTWSRANPPSLPEGTQ